MSELGSLPILHVLGMTNSGNIKSRPTSDIKRPPIVPTANENQKPADCPSIRKGMNPSTVDRIVDKMGMSLWLQAVSQHATASLRQLAPDSLQYSSSK